MDPDQTKLFFDSEIFNVQQNSSAKTIKESNNSMGIKVKTNFKQSNSFPKSSIYGQSQIEFNQTRKETNNWITIIGYRLNLLEEILTYFSKYGNILRYNDTPGNLLYVEFDTPENAQKPVQECLFNPILINNSYCVYVTKGKIRPQYELDEENMTNSLNDKSDLDFGEAVEPKPERSFLYKLFGI